jgi:acyl-homoserine lactone acylase PvdQ
LISRSSGDTSHYGNVFNFTFNTGNDLMLTVLFGGQSEEFTSTNYTDQTYLWSLGAYSEINFTKNIEQFENLEFLIKKK